MEYRILGKTGLRVARLGLGGIPIQRIDELGTRELLRIMLAEGINYIDTARDYTVSEEHLGFALEGIREHFILASKSRDVSKQEMEEDSDRSLHNLRTNYIDLYQFHNPSNAALNQIIAPGGALEALWEARAAGKICHIGATTHSVEVFRRLLDMEWVETIMFPYNIVENQAESLIAQCREKNIGFICMKPLAGGTIEDGRLALRYVASNENVTEIIPGMAEPKELEQNVDAVQDITPLSEQEKAGIQKVRDSLGTQFCRRCNYCAPCTAGISIPSAFLFEGYLTRYGLADWAKDHYQALAHTASECVQCGLCEERCPYHLPIRDMMKHTAEQFGY